MDGTTDSESQVSRVSNVPSLGDVTVEGVSVSVLSADSVEITADIEQDAVDDVDGKSDAPGSSRSVAILFFGQHTTFVTTGLTCFNHLYLPLEERSKLHAF